MEEIDLETVYDANRVGEDIYIVPERLFDPIKLYFTWNNEKDLEEYPSFYVRISPNTWNQKTNMICSWMVNTSEDEDEHTETIQVLKQSELVDYVYYLFQNLYYDENPTDDNEIALPNMPTIKLQSKKVHNTEYMEAIANYITGYIVFLTNHWPVRKSRLVSEPPMKDRTVPQDIDI